MRAFLERSIAAVVLAQELHIVDSDGIATATAWARARGWQAVIAPATPTVGRGSQAGVGIFVRADRAALGPAVVTSPSRAIAAPVVFQDGSRVGIASVYCWTSAGTEPASLALLADAAAVASTLGDHFLIGGDFQATPRRFAPLVRVPPFAPSSARRLAVSPRVRPSRAARPWTSFSPRLASRLELLR
jgi:hypothetical protein